MKIIGHAAGTIKPYICPEVIEKGIVLINVASEIAYSVAEFTLALMLNLLRLIPQHVKAFQEGKENVYKKENLMKTRDLRGRVVGIIGVGNVARKLIELLKPFNVKILAYDPYLPDDNARSLGIIKVDLVTLLRESEIITVHAAYTPETRHMIGEKELSLVKDGTIFVYTARAGIVDQETLIREALKGRIMIALDTFEKPIPQNHPARNHPNIILTPHIAGPSGERRRKLFGRIVENFKIFFQGGTPPDIIPPEKLPVLA